MIYKLMNWYSLSLRDLFVRSGFAVCQDQNDGIPGWFEVSCPTSEFCTILVEHFVRYWLNLAKLSHSGLYGASHQSCSFWRNTAPWGRECLQRTTQGGALQRAVGYSGNLECLASVFQVCQTLKRYGKVKDFTIICHCVGRTSTFFCVGGATNIWVWARYRQDFCCLLGLNLLEFWKFWDFVNSFGGPVPLEVDGL